MDKNKNSNEMKDKIKEICNKLNREQLSVHGATEELLVLFSVGKSVVCGNCDGWGYTVDENGRRKDHCKQCE